MTSVLIQFLGRIESAPVFSYELAKGLLSNNIDVCAILHKEVENRDKWINLLGEDNICFVSQYISKKKIITSSIKFYEEWNNIKNKFRNKEFDYIICTFPGRYDALIGSAVRGKKKVNFCHDPIAHSGVKKKDANANKKIIRRADKIVVLTQSFIPIVEKNYGFDRKNILFIRHGLLPYKENYCFTEKNYNPNEPWRFLFFGRIDPYKGVGILVNAFSKLNKEGTELIIAGRGNIEDIFDNSIIFCNVQIVNKYLNDEEIDLLFNKSNIVLVLPYIDATQSGVATIAFEYGVPIIASDTGGLREQLFDGEVGKLVPSNDDEALKNAMEEYISSPELYDIEAHKMSLYREKLAWPMLAKQLIQGLN